MSAQSGEPGTWRDRSRQMIAGVLTATGVLGLPAAASAKPHKVLDLRTMTDPAGEFSVSLCSRPSANDDIPGHAYVVYSVKPHNGERKILALGFTTAAGPAKAALSYRGWLSSVDGYLGEERYTNINENCLVVLVNKNAYEAAFAKAHPLAAIPGLESVRFIGQYELSEKDCMTFVIDVASALKGVKIPVRGATEFPQPYIRRLIDSN